MPPKKKLTKSSESNIGVLKKVKINKGWIFLTVKLEVSERIQDFFFGREEETDIDFYVGSCYEFKWEQNSKQKTPNIIKNTWKCLLEEEPYILSEESRNEYENIKNIWDVCIKHFESSERRKIFENIQNRIEDPRIENVVMNWDDIFEEGEKLRQEIQETNQLLQDIMFKRIIEHCPNIGQWLNWNYSANKSNNKTNTVNRWSFLQDNPYQIVYLQSKRDESKQLRKIKSSGEVAIMDQLFVENLRIGKDDDRRVEYYYQDTIHYGISPLRNKSTCFTDKELYAKVHLRKRKGVSKKYDPEEDDDDNFEDETIIKNLTFNLPSDKALLEFLERVKLGASLHPLCKGRIVYDKEHFYDIRIWNYEKGIARQLSNFLFNHSQENSLSKDWDIFENEYPIFQDQSFLSKEQKKEILTMIDTNFYILLGTAGTGKCLDPDTPVLLYDGSIKIAKDIVKGELLMGDDSKPRRVIGTCSGQDNMFKIIPSKGKSFICNEPHVLTLVGIEPFVKSTKTKSGITFTAVYSRKGCINTDNFCTEKEAFDYLKYKSRDVFDIPLGDYLKTTKEFKRHTYLYHKEVQFPDRKQAADPYHVGYWLGICNITEANDVIKEEFFDNGIKSELLKEGIFNDIYQSKRIPEIYKINSRLKRLSLLAGIIDSIGLNAGDHFAISLKNLSLVEDIEYLAFSLGFTAIIKRVSITYTYDEKLVNEPYNIVSIFGNELQEIPTVLISKIYDSNPKKERLNCFRFKIKPLGKGDYSGFELDGNGRFLLGNFMVTHNTSTEIALILFLEWLGMKVYVATMVGMAAVRAADILQEKLLKINAISNSDPLKTEISPRTLCKLLADLSTADGETTRSNKGVVLVLDEMSTICYELPCRVMLLEPPDRLYCFGDDKQLPPILGQHLLDDLLDFSLRNPEYKFIGYLTEIKRGKHSTAQLVADMWNCQTETDCLEWMKKLESCEHIKWNKETESETLMVTIDQLIHESVPKKQKFDPQVADFEFPFIMAPTHKVIDPLNVQVRKKWLKYKNTHSYQALHDLEEKKRSKVLLEDDIVMCKKNLYKIREEDEEAVSDDDEDDDYEDKKRKLIGKSLIYAHGEFGLVNSIVEEKKMAIINKIKPNGISTQVGKYEQKRFKPIYVVSFHKGQGSELPKSVVLLGDVMELDNSFSHVGKFVGRRSGYTALTRHSQKCYMFASEEQVMSMLNNIDNNGYRSHLVERLEENLYLLEKEETKKSLEVQKIINECESNDSAFDDTNLADVDELPNPQIFHRKRVILESEDEGHNEKVQKTDNEIL